MKRTPWFLALAATVALSSSARAADRVLVIPFNVFNVPASQQWIGKGAQENLIADLGRTGSLSPIAFNGQVIVEDNATAARLARSANAPLAIRGSAQVVGDNVRLTAQLIDSKSGDTLRTALVTGSASDLLKLEDDLANQIRGTTASTPLAAAAPVTAPAAPPPIIIISQPPPAYYPNYPSNYNYPYNYYPLVVYPAYPGNRGRGRGGNGGGNTGNGGGNGGRSGAPNTAGGFNPSGLPLPNNNVLPLPNNNILPLPNNNVLPLAQNQFSPLPTNHSSPIPTVSPATPRVNAGQNLNPRLVN